jgi:16S rRNA G966 N2-methylase RsmD
LIPGVPVQLFHSTPTPAEPAKLIFLDPPYRFLNEQPQRLQQLAEKLRDHLAPDGLVVFRHDAADRLDLPALDRADARTYGGMEIELLRRGAERPS